MSTTKEMIGKSCGDSSPSWTFSIPDWKPPSKNESRGRTFRREHALKQSTASVVGVYAHIAGVVRVTDTYRPKRRVTLRVVYPKIGKLPDSHNLFMIFLDALKLARLIVDDADKFLECPPPEVVRGSGKTPLTTITIEDIPLKDVS
jgi:hypothetical protein